MTNHVARLYTTAGAIVVFFLLWATIAAHPWATTEQVTQQDPRLAALALREKRLQKRAAEVKRVVDHRWAVYEKRSARRRWQNAVALQRHLQQLELSQAAAVRAAQVAVSQTAQAREYAASVVSWANQQLRAQGGTAPTASVSRSDSTQTPTVSSHSVATPVGKAAVPTRAAAPGVTESPARAGTTTSSAPAPTPVQIAAAPPAAPAAAPPAPVAVPAPAPTPVQAAAPPPVQVVTLPPVTTTKPSAKK